MSPDVRRYGARSPPESIDVLYVDDDGALRDLVATRLERETADAGTGADTEVGGISVETAPDVATGMAVLEAGGVDCVVSDYHMPGADGLTFLRRVRSRRPDLPFVLYTSEGSESIAADAITAGVTDYVRKGGGSDQYALLANRIRRAVGHARSRRRTRRLAGALAAAREGICLLDGAGRFEYANDAYLNLYGHDRASLVGAPWQLVHPDDEVERIEREVLPAVASTGSWTGDSVGLRADGERFPEWKSVADVGDGLVIVVADRRRLDDGREEA